MKREYNITIEYCKQNDFTFGACACVAICQAFDIPKAALRAVFFALGLKKYEEGITFAQTTKVINILSKAYHINAVYKPNLALIKYEQFIPIFDKGKYIFMFDEHLSYMEKGIIYDSYLMVEGERREKYLKYPPTGYWEIKL